MPKKPKKKIIEILKEINDFIISVKVKQKKIDELGKPLKEHIADKILKVMEEEIKRRTTPMYQYHDVILNKGQAKMVISWLKKSGEKVKLKDLEIK